MVKTGTKRMKKKRRKKGGGGREEAIVFKKFQEMNFSIDGAAIIITKIEGSRDVNAWLGDAHGQPYPNSIRLPYYDSPSITDIMFAIESGMDYFSKTYGFEEKNHWFKYAFENTDLKILTDDLKNDLRKTRK